jgi:hypothetical protein
MSDETAEGNDHVVIEMAELAPGNEKDKQSNDKIKPKQPLSDPTAPWTAPNALSRTQRDEQFDQEMLRRAIADTGRWAYGTISVEAWILDETTGKLIRPQRAFWFDPVAVREGQDNESMMRLVDDSREDFVRPDPLAPGIGLAGALWSELSHKGGNRQMAMPTKNRGSMRMLDEVMANNRNVAWREVEPIAQDPDQPYNLRLHLVVEAGIGLAAGVKYQFRGTQGLVVYMAPPTTDITKLKSETNEQYLLSAADVIGSIVAMRGPRKDCVEARRGDRESVRRRLRQNMVAFIRAGGSFLAKSNEKKYEDGEARELPDRTSGGMEQSLAAPVIANKRTPGTFIKTKMKLVASKCRGANNEPPPPFSTIESIWSFAGSFLTLLMLFAFSDAISKRNPEYKLVTGPFGALMTLQYSLTAAPASQPRNAMFGQAISISIALGMTHTPLGANVRRALGTSLSIFCMSRFGCIHPPAGAAALIFSGGGYTWVHMGIMLAGNVLAIFFATIINDLNVKRQYPTFWGFGYWRKYFFNREERVKSA